MAQTLSQTIEPHSEQKHDQKHQKSTIALFSDRAISPEQPVGQGRFVDADFFTAFGPKC